MNINRDFPEFDDRLREIKLLRKAVLQALKQGHNPYDEVASEDYSLFSALDFALGIKKTRWK